MPETNETLCINYASVKKKKKKSIAMEMAPQFTGRSWGD